MVLYGAAVGILDARVALGAWILTLLIDACFGRWALTVAGTLWGMSHRLQVAALERIANVTGRARTDGSVILSATFRRAIAWVSIDARVDAVVILAGVSLGTVAV